MSAYEVTYRDTDARKKTITLEASSRDAVWAALKAKGIQSVVKIEELQGKVRSQSSGGIAKGIAAALIVITASIAAFYMISRKDGSIGEVKKVKGGGVIASATPSKAGDAPDMEESTKEPEEQVEKPNPLRSPQFENMTQDEKLEVIAERLAETPIPEASTNRTFRTGLEQVIEWVFTTEVGDAPPPLPNLSNFDLVHIEEILDLENPVHETDSDKAAESKETVDFVKKELKKFLEKGGAAQEFLEFYHSELKQAYQERQMVQQQAMQVLQEEPDLVFDFLEQANKTLAEKGIKPASIPKRILMRYGLSEE